MARDGGTGQMAYRKYMFDLDFDPQAPARAKAEEEHRREEEQEAEEPPPPPAPMFTEEELQLAREAAYEEGRQAGHAEAEESLQQQIAGALTALSNQMEGVFSRQTEVNDQNARNAVRVAMAVVRKVLPAACERHAFDEVARVVEQVVAHILDEPRIIVRVAAGLVDPVRERLEAVAEGQGFEGRVVVQADARLVPGDCRVEWTDGGAERDQARLMAEVEAAVERALAEPQAPAGSDDED